MLTLPISVFTADSGESSQIVYLGASVVCFSPDGVKFRVLTLEGGYGTETRHHHSFRPEPEYGLAGELERAGETVILDGKRRYTLQKDAIFDCKKIVPPSTSRCSLYLGRKPDGAFIYVTVEGGRYEVFIGKSRPMQPGKVQVITLSRVMTDPISNWGDMASCDLDLDDYIIIHTIVGVIIVEK